MPGFERQLVSHPPAPAATCPADWVAYAEIRKRFKVPHDGLRHIAISASQFGNSETMIGTHYFNRMSKEEAAMFFSLVPADPAAGAPPA